MKKLLAILLAAALLIPCLAFPASAADHPFTDVSSGSWFAENVQYVYDHQLMNGVEAARFGPEETMTRAMLVTVLYRMDGSKTVTGELPFQDVAPGEWYYDAVRWAYERRVTTGVDAVTFSPNDPITREMLVTFFYRYANEIAMDTSETDDLYTFDDTDKISDYAFTPFQWAVQDGVVNGFTETELYPAGNATRAQCAAIMQRFCTLEKPASRYDESLKPPTVQSVFARDYYLGINCPASFTEDDGCGYECFFARDKGFSNGLVIKREDSQWNELGYAKFSYFYAAGTYYYKLRAYKIENGVYVYGPWSDVRDVTCNTFNTKVDRPAQYSYELYFMDNLGTEVYTQTVKAIYIKTDNPDLASINLVANGKSILGDITAWDGEQYFDDVEYLDGSDYDEVLHRVPGGYLGMLYAQEAGTLTVEVQEANGEGYTVAKTFQLNVQDYGAACDQWMDSVIAAQTTSSMNPKEKMDAVSGYLAEEAGFRYVTVQGDYLVTLAAQPNAPCFVSKRWDSATSPFMLARFAKRIGGFEDVHNCYGDYPRGTQEWVIYHHQIYVTYNGENIYYTVCPTSDTGDVGMVQKIDFSDVSKLRRVV